MAGIKSFYHHLVWLFKGVRVFGLVGKAGTGKSFRAQLIAKRFGIEMLIDDGLLIREQRIIAGKSAKQEKGAYSAVKTALFDDPNHTRDVREALERETFKRILILGTSERMIQRIARRLNLPHPSRTINIEDVATPEEIEKAKHSRNREGKHIIPVPAVEVKRKHAHIFFNAVRIFFKRQFGLVRKHDIFEKSIVRPVFANKGRISISEEALTQMVLHCVAEFDPTLTVKKVIFTDLRNNYGIEILLTVPFRTQLSGSIHSLQQYILENIENYTGLVLEEVSITIDTIA
jgi:uncharacterized alkaline shock family protein YloU